MYQLEYAHLRSIRCLDFGSPDAKMTTKSRTYVMELAGIGHGKAASSFQLGGIFTPG